MHNLVSRSIESFVNENLSVFPAVVILGPRQCGKSTLVKMLYQNSDNYLYMDLQNIDDLMEQTFILHSLPPFEKNIRKRLVKSPKIYVRDSGLLHRLLQIDDFNSLMGNPVFGSSWEGFVIENIIASLNDCKFSFYRSATGDELDLLIERGSRMVAVECKASSAPQVTKGFWNALKTVKPDKTYLIAPVSASYLFKNDVEVCGLSEFLLKVRELLY